MRYLRYLVLSIIFLTPLTLSAQETLPPYHWANDYIDYLKVQGYLPDLSFINRPFDRPEIARQLLNIDWVKLAQSPTDRAVVKTLYREFSPEMRLLGRSDVQKWRPLLKKAREFLQLEIPERSPSPGIKAGAFGEAGFNYRGDSGDQFGDVDFHTQFGMFWKNQLTFYNNFKVFNRADSNYIGKEFRGLFGFVEQGYVGIHKKWFQAKFGRDFLQLGPGRSGQLLISDNSRPFDMYHIRVGGRVFQFSFWGIMLNKRPLKDDQLRTLSVAANRYLNGHRFSLNLKNRIFIGVSEVILYGGPERTWELGFMNPFGIYYMHNVNLEPGASNGNVLYNLDWDLYLLPRLEIYGEFLLDDFQIDKKVPGDLEPNELGFLGGIKWANPLHLAHSVLDAEYVQIRNRTYNVSSSDWEKFLHRNEVIGFFAGNNLERLEGGLTYWLHPDFRVRLFSTLTRQGEGSVQGEFNQDYLNFTVEEGYSEPFPFGTVERRFRLGLSAFFKPHRYGHIGVDIFWDDVANYRHVVNRNFSEVTARVSLWLQWSNFWRWRNR